jgi:hypothetical protein
MRAYHIISDNNIEEHRTEQHVLKGGEVNSKKIREENDPSTLRRPSTTTICTDLATLAMYSLWGSNPRPMAHKTIALTTELREHCLCIPTQRP